MNELFFQSHQISFYILIAIETFLIRTFFVRFESIKVGHAQYRRRPLAFYRLSIGFRFLWVKTCIDNHPLGDRFTRFS